MRIILRLLTISIVALCSAPAPPSHAQAAQGENWELFSAGAQPKGTMLAETEAATLADGAPTERSYLIGQFIVTASGANRAVFRSGGGVPIRIVVAYPAGLKAPPEGAVVGRDEAHPLLITNVRRGQDGQITVYTREVIKP